MYNQDDGSCSIAGCMANSSEFDALATFHVQCFCDGTCGGGQNGRRLADTVNCWDPAASNYQADSSGDADCVYLKTGCTDSIASNYLPMANQDDGSCIFPVYGCTIADDMLNFDSMATVLSGCISVGAAPTAGRATSFPPQMSTITAASI